MAVLNPNEIFFTAFEPKQKNRFIAFVDGLTYNLIDGADGSRAYAYGFTFMPQTKKGATLNVDAYLGSPGLSVEMNFRDLIVTHTDELAQNAVITLEYTLNFIGCEHNCTAAGDLNFDSAIINNIGCIIKMPQSSRFFCRGARGIDLHCSFYSKGDVGIFYYSNAIVTRTVAFCLFRSSDILQPLLNANTTLIDGGGNRAFNYASYTANITFVSTDVSFFIDPDNGNFELLPNSPALN